ncbi:hypothetical protein TIFTF001_056385 [Ficus carica]|uniref:C3H1-type domain-containing protein n=1 Tax=Ficus carica TaxID=3494 RepID=A0AA88EHS6_FICCA|nr:hypothetical protein TIFTF001_056385 [Ficus carica]
MEVLPHSGERGTKKKPYYSQQRNKRNVRKSEGDTTAKPERNDNRKERLCKFWASGNCVKGDRCPFLHSWSNGDRVSTITTLKGHNKRSPSRSFIVSPAMPHRLVSSIANRELTYSINVSCELSLSKYNY